MNPTTLELPPRFIHTIHATFGAAGAAWLARLPTLLNESVTRWGLTLGDHMPLSYNYVTAARRADSSEVILKLGVPNHERLSEIHALRLWDGAGACRLLETDEANAMFLLERLCPGNTLVSLGDDEACTHIAADLMTRLWRTPATSHGFITLSAWFAGLRALRPTYQGGTGPFPAWLVERVEAVLPTLWADSQPPVLLHGDFHHANVLASARGWLTIDPKGVLGPRAYEVGPLLMNPMPDFPHRPTARRQTARRLAILSERLNLPPEQLSAWGLCHCLLSAWWNLPSDNTGTDYAIACAEILAQASTNN